MKQRNLTMWEGSFLIHSGSTCRLEETLWPSTSAGVRGAPLTPGLPHKHVVWCLVLLHWRSIGENCLPVRVLSRVHWLHRSIRGSCRQRADPLKPFKLPHQQLTQIWSTWHERNLGTLRTWWWMDELLIEWLDKSCEWVFHHWRGSLQPKQRLR